MKRLFLLLLVAAAVWYGWQNRDSLFQRKEGHEAVIENSGDREMTRVRLTVAGKTYVDESIPPGEEARFAFSSESDASFQLVWQWANAPAELTWSGGMVPRGPMRQRHYFTVDADGSVFYRAENK